MIEPALTPEEWAEWGDPSAKHGFVTGCQDEGLNGHEGSAHMIAALALHGEDCGFTWEDVEHLRLVAGQCAELRLGPNHAYVLRDLADRIAALLPPRAPNEAA